MGIEASNIDRLYPIQLAINPKDNPPKMAPIARNEPIQPAVSWDMGPSNRGLGIVLITGSAGEYHPMLHPWLKVRMLPTIDTQMQLYVEFYQTNFLPIKTSKN